MKEIVIIGGGFSGTMTAVNLARLARAPLRVTLVNGGYPDHRGVAYSTRRPEHLLNVVARNMSALPDQPNHFLDWLRTRSEYAETPDHELRESFMPRLVYGDYVRALAWQSAHPLAPERHVEFTTVTGLALDVVAAGDGWEVRLADGARLAADKVVLACGNEAPAELPGADALHGHRAWCANPWVDWRGRLPGPGQPVVVLGTGLTMVDTVMSLLKMGWGGVIRAISRNGWLPRPHFKGFEYEDFPPKDVDLAALGLAELTRLVETQCARVASLGGNPAIIVDKIRPHTQRIWQAFTLAEKRQFAESHAGRWNVIRHRIAPTIHAELTQALAADRLVVDRGSILGVGPQGGMVRVRYRAPDGSECHIDAGLVINATGPHTRFSKTKSTLLQSLLAGNVVQPDEMDMGIRVAPDFSAIAPGTGDNGLFAIGPLLRGTLWESIAVPELRVQALTLARTLIDQCLPGANGPEAWAPEPQPEAVMEYFI